MICADLHNHTSISHGAADVSAMYAEAKARGLAWFGFSEHSPLPAGYDCPLYTGDLAGDFPTFAEKVLSLREKSASPRVLLGLELDWTPADTAYMHELAARWPFDYVLGSVHFLGMLPVGAPSSWREDEPERERFKRFDAYFHEVMNMASAAPIDIVAHPDFVKIRCVESFRAWLSLPASLELVRALLAVMQRKGLAMEVSSGGLRKPCAEFFPAPPIMRLARDMGIAISFGSDAHDTREIAADFPRLAEYARSFGYREGVVFERHMPRSLAF